MPHLFYDCFLYESGLAGTPLGFLCCSRGEPLVIWDTGFYAPESFPMNNARSRKEMNDTANYRKILS